MEKIIDVEITGRSPLMMHRPNLEDFERDAKRINKKVDKREEAEKGAYRMKSGELFIPAVALHRALINASSGLKLGKKSIMPLVAGTVRIEPFEIGLGTKNYELDVRMVRVGGFKGGSILRARPRLDKWKASFRILVEDEYGLDPSMIATCLKDAGVRIGILEYSPRNKGIFGQFEITKFKVDGKDLVKR